MIELEGFSVERDGQVVVHDVTVSVPSGHALAVIGPNGGGKSTFLAGIRQRLATTGVATLAAKPAARLSRHEIARTLSVVPQRMEFSFPYTVHEMTLFGRAPYRRPWESYSAEDRELAAEAIERVGLGHVAQRRVDTLSGGERRKVFIARALAQQTPVMLLDEPTAGLDPAAQEDLVRIMEQLRHDESVTMVAVLHDVRLAQRIGDLALGLRDGRPRFCGAPRDVINASSLEELYGIPWVEVGEDRSSPVFVTGRRKVGGA